MQPPGPAARRSPLHEEHLRFGGRMVESGGWTMPVEFAGAFREYQALRRGAVVWDVSNLGSIRVSGSGAYALIQRCLTNDLRRCRPGRSQYSFLLDEADASIVDDLMVWWVNADTFVLTPNRPAEVLRALWSVSDGDPRLSCVIEDLSGGRVLLALQGAAAPSRMAELAPEAATMPPFRVRELRIGDHRGLVATTRFGGASGFELQLAPAPGRAIYRLLVDRGLAPAGLGMRETHRVEAGIPRHGLELVPAVTPLEIGLTRAVGFDTDFIGRMALARRRQRGVDKVLRAIVADGRRVPDRGSDLLLGGRRVGQVTSSNYSPRLHRGLALGFVRPDVAPGSAVTIRGPRGTMAGEVAGVPVDLEAAP